MATLDIFSGIGNLFSAFESASITRTQGSMQANTIIQGGEVAAQGALLSAAGFRESAKAVAGATQFNLGVQQINTQRQLSSMARQMQRVVGRQLNTQAKTGLSLTSKSFLMVQAETSNFFEQQILNLKVDAENQRKSMIYESNVRQVQLENQARAAEYQAAAERVLAANRAAQARYAANSSASSSITSGFSSILGSIFK